MRKKLLCIAISLSVPLLLFVNVWQSQKYMLEYFEIKDLITTQDRLVVGNKDLVNRVAELESPTRVVDIVDENMSLDKIAGGDIVRIQVVDDNE